MKEGEREAQRIERRAWVARLFLLSLSQREEGGGQEYSCLNYLPSSHSPPPPSTYPEPEGRRGVSQQLTHGPEERGGGAASQLAHLNRR